MEEITLLDALQRLWHFKAKRKTLVFEVTFDDGITRKAYFGKSWSRVTGNWQYIVQDGEHAPGFCYNEKAAVSAYCASIVFVGDICLVINIYLLVG